MEPLKKKKKISGYYIWVTKGRINQKEKKKENIGSEIPVLGRDLSAPWPLKYRCSAIQNLYEQHISTRTCISKVAIYYWRDISLNIRRNHPGGVYSDNSNNWKSFLSSKFRTWTGSNCASIHSNFDLQKYNPFKIKDTPPFIHLHYLSEARWWCKTMQGEEEERRGARKIGLVISQKFMDWRVQGRGRGTQLGEFPRQKAIDRGGWEETRR